MKQWAKRIGIALLLVCVLAGVAYGSYATGLKDGTKRSVVITDSKQLINADFSLFWDAIDMVRGKFVDAEGVKDEKLLYGAIKGAIAAFDDPYTSYFEPSDAKKFEEDLQGSFGGIGAEIGMRNEQILIISPLKGNPAEAVGLKPMDKILKIGDKFTAGMTVEDAVKMIRGEAGTEVSLLIMRNGWTDAKDFTIKRAVINVPTLDTAMKTLPSGKKVVHMQLYNFNANVPELFYNASFAAAKNGADGVVLDMRNNPGGFLDVATEIAGWFMQGGKVVVKERTRDGSEEVLRANGNAAFADLPVVVLVNAGSASASEILAGALRDNRGAKLIGEKTFGKGSVQEVERMKNGATIKVTIAHWLTPNGEKIDKVGLKPDIEVLISDADAEKKKDPQLDKALEVIDAEFAKVQ